MNYNLLQEEWIRVRHESGATSFIKPADIVGGSDPVITIDTGRPDFDASLTEFLIGLMQTAVAPENAKAWRKWFQEPPTAATLQQAYTSLLPAFNLLGQGRRFMQDIALEKEQLEPKSVGSLLIDEPGDNALKLNKDLFKKRGLVDVLSLPAAAMAVFALQSNAPSGGQGHRTSLRGGGPLRTLVLGGNLWETVWINVLPIAELAALPGGSGDNDLASIFPWMADTRTSHMNETIHADEVHVLVHYWATPRRILLHDPVGDGQCAILGYTAPRAITSVSAKSHGNNYGEVWSHPLTPYSGEPGKPLNPRKAQSHGLSYEDWPLWAVGGTNLHPAATVRIFAKDRRRDQLEKRGLQARLWVCGFDMDNAKARCWRDTTTPLLDEPLGEGSMALSEFSQSLVSAAKFARKESEKQIKVALFDSPKHAKGDFTFVRHAFWQKTEHRFYSSIEEFAFELTDLQAKNEGDDRAVEKTSLKHKEAWLEELAKASKETFKMFVQLNADVGVLNIKRVAVAWNALRAFTSARSAGSRKAVGLAPLKKNVRHTKPVKETAP